MVDNMQTELNKEHELKGKAVRSKIVRSYEHKGVSPQKAEAIAGAVAGEEHRERIKKYKRSHALIPVPA